jgi:Ca-activated chloride channel family protein
MALAEAGARLKNSHAKSKVIILITDGVNNTGAIDPKTAAEIVKALGIKAYTIGIGSKEGGHIPMGRDIFGRIVYSQEVMELDEELLKSIAGTTGGKFYLARDSRALNEVFSEIDRLEKSEFERKAPRRHREAFRFLLFPAFALLFLRSLSRLHD